MGIKKIHFDLFISNFNQQLKNQFSKKKPKFLIQGINILKTHQSSSNENHKNLKQCKIEVILWTFSNYIFHTGYSSIELSKQSRKSETVENKPDFKTALAHVRKNADFLVGVSIFSEQHALAPARFLYEFIPFNYKVLRVMVGDPSFPENLKPYEVGSIDAERNDETKKESFNEILSKIAVITVS